MKFNFNTLVFLILIGLGVDLLIHLHNYWGMGFEFVLASINLPFFVDIKKLLARAVLWHYGVCQKHYCDMGVSNICPFCVHEEAEIVEDRIMVAVLTLKGFDGYECSTSKS
jgi:hypothetical protein